MICVLSIYIFSVDYCCPNLTISVLLSLGSKNVSLTHALRLSYMIVHSSENRP